MSEENTGQCYNRAFKVMLNHYEKKHNIRLVHGTPKYFGEGDGDSHDGERMQHAWIEITPRDPIAPIVVMDGSQGIEHLIVVTRKQYYDLGEIEEEHVIRYTPEEAINTALEFNHYGPWNDDHPPVPEGDQ